VNVTASIDLRPFSAAFKALVEKQWPFATANAINATARDVQNAGRNRVTQALTIAPSRVEFMRRMIEFPSSHRATKRNPSATVGIGVTQRASRGPTGQRGAMLIRHEFGGSNTRTSADPFYVPTDDLRATDHSLIPAAMYPANLRLASKRSVTTYLAAQTKGKRRTFVIRSVNANATGIYQRYGKRPDEIRMIWRYENRITLKPRLRFIETATKVAQARFEENWSVALHHAIRTAK
jgi:hypothetical protein